MPVNQVPLLVKSAFLSLSERQLCLSCQDTLSLAPINKHHGAEMETSPASGPTEDVPFQHFPNPTVAFDT